MTRAELLAIFRHLVPSAQIKKVEIVQDLWNGYGKLCRLYLSEHTIIAKLIQFPKDQTSFSHQRKVKSYSVEEAWYKQFNNKSKKARTANLIESGKALDRQFLLLEDLQVDGFQTVKDIGSQQVERCLRWLAYFHAFYLGHDPNPLWQIGTYWHLATRPEEFAALENTKLKEKAKTVDQVLHQAKFQTIVHGDAKLANFLFNEHEAAAVDFQYVGGGVGIKDVAYFLSSIYNAEELSSQEGPCLDKYFEYLKNALTEFNKKEFFPQIETEYRFLYPYAWCDFYRFIKGWSPEHWKAHAYSKEMTKRVLDELDS